MTWQGVRTGSTSPWNKKKNVTRYNICSGWKCKATVWKVFSLDKNTAAKKHLLVNLDFGLCFAFSICSVESSAYSISSLFFLSRCSWASLSSVFLLVLVSKTCFFIYILISIVCFKWLTTTKTKAKKEIEKKQQSSYNLKIIVKRNSA